MTFLLTTGTNRQNIQLHKYQHCQIIMLQRFVLLPYGHTSTCEECGATRWPQCGKIVKTKYHVFLCVYMNCNQTKCFIAITCEGDYVVNHVGDVGMQYFL